MPFLNLNTVEGCFVLGPESRVRKPRHANNAHIQPRETFATGSTVVPSKSFALELNIHNFRYERHVVTTADSG